MIQVKPTNRLAEILKAHGWTQRILASQTGLSESYINRIKNHRVESPTVATASIIARALRVTIEEIFPYEAGGRRG